MGVDHSNTITVNLFFSASPPGRQGFNAVMYLVDQATNSLNGARTKSYADTTEVATDLAASYISSATSVSLTALFAQIPRPASVKIGRVDIAGAETYADALSAVEAIDTDWWGLCCDSRADADILLLSSAAETRNIMFVAQSNDADWITTGLPAGLSALASRERTAMVYHDEDSADADLAWAASRLVFDPDSLSAGWEGQLRSVAALTTGLTSAQRGFVLDTNNANVVLPFSSAPQYMSPGQNMVGRGVYEILSGDWFRVRVSEDVAFLKLEHTARGEKIIVDATGQAKIMGILTSRLAQGESAGHFVKGQTRATAEAITAADETARRLRFKVEAQIAGDAKLFVFNVYLQPDALQES